MHQWRDLLQRNGVSNCVFYSHTMFIKDTSKAARSYDDTTSKGPGVWVNRLRGRARHTRALGVRPTPRKEHPPTIITIGPREWETRGQAGGTGGGEGRTSNKFPLHPQLIRPEPKGNRSLDRLSWTELQKFLRTEEPVYWTNCTRFKEMNWNCTRILHDFESRYPSLRAPWRPISCFYPALLV